MIGFFQKRVYDANNLPPFVPGTRGWARPNPAGDIVACLMPETREIHAPWGVLVGEGGKHYHQISRLDNGKGQIDEYPNDQFTEDFRVLRTLKRGGDPRGDRLFDLYGDGTTVVLAQKTAPVIVLGRAKKAGKFRTSESKGDKVHDFVVGAVVVTNLARTRHWVISSQTFAKNYEKDGAIYVGVPPADTASKSL